MSDGLDDLDDDDLRLQLEAEAGELPFERDAERTRVAMPEWRAALLYDIHVAYQRGLAGYFREGNLYAVDWAGRSWPGWRGMCEDPRTREMTAYMRLPVGPQPGPKGEALRLPDAYSRPRDVGKYFGGEPNELGRLIFDHPGKPPAGGIQPLKVVRPKGRIGAPAVICDAHGAPLEHTLRIIGRCNKCSGCGHVRSRRLQKKIEVEFADAHLRGCQVLFITLTFARKVLGQELTEREKRFIRKPYEYVQHLSTVRAEAASKGIDFDALPADEQARRMLRELGTEVTRFVARLKKLHGSAAFRFVIVPELHRDGTLHFHMLLFVTEPGLQFDWRWVQRQWWHGWSSVFEADASKPSYLAKYVRDAWARPRKSHSFGVPLAVRNQAAAMAAAGEAQAEVCREAASLPAPLASAIEVIRRRGMRAAYVREALESARSPDRELPKAPDDG